MVIQLVNSKIEGDYVITQANSSEIIKYGWLGGKKNTPAAYLLGFVVGLKAIKKGEKEACLDLGLSRPSKGSKIFAAVKGALDAGLKIPCDNEIFPDKSRIKGEKISNYAKGLKESLDYQRIFSGYLKRRLKPEKMPEHFERVKTTIEESNFE